MANSQSVSSQFKSDSMAAVLNGAAQKAALYLASASKGATDTVYNTTGEVTGTNYTAGGVSVTNANTVAVTGSTAYWTPSANIVYTNVTLATAFDAVQIYRTSDNHLVGTWVFGSQTITAGTLTLTVPTNDAANALLRC